MLFPAFERFLLQFSVGCRSLDVEHCLIITRDFFSKGPVHVPKILPHDLDD